MDVGSSPAILDSNEVQDVVPQLDFKKRKLTSEVHEHFSLMQDKLHFKCKYCSKSYQKGGGATSGMKRHIEKIHPSILQDRGASTSGSIVPPSPVLNNETLMNGIVEFVLETDQAFSIVDDSSFKRLIRLINPEVKLPGRTTLRDAVSKRYQKEKELVAAQLQEIPGKLSFMVDCWTSANQWAFQGIVVQGISKNWELISIALDLTILEGSHTGINLASQFMKVLEEFSIVKKVHSITTDNASNMDTFFTNFEEQMKIKEENFKIQDFRVRCLAHILNFCCQSALDSLRAKYDPKFDSISEEAEQMDGTNLPILTKKQRTLPARFPTSTRAIPQCDVLGIEKKELVLDIKTRWNSTIAMITRAVEYREPLEYTLRREKKLHSWILSAEEWASITKMIILLKPFEDMTVLMSKQDFPTISFCALVYSKIFGHLEKYRIDPKRKLKAIDPCNGRVHPKWLRDAASKAYDKLGTYYPSSDGLVYVIGTVLDPRCKMDWFHLAGFTEQKRTRYLSEIKTFWINNYKEPDSEEDSTELEPSSSSVENEQDIFMQFHQKQSMVVKKDEMERYLSEPTVRSDSQTNGALGWWKNHEEDYPMLSKMARDFLSASGTSVPSERLFSSGSTLINPRRQRMKPSTIRECVCTKNWTKSKSQALFKEELCLAVSEKMCADC